MTKKLILVSLSLLFFSLGFSQNKTKKSNMRNVTWDTKTHVVHCSDFGITKPLSELMKEAPAGEVVNIKVKEQPDKRDMPVQSFPFTVEKDGAKYGCDPSVIQSENGKVKGKAPIQSWAGQTGYGFRPFDPSGAVGPNHYIQLINGDSYQIWDKSGTSLGSGAISALWSPAGGDGDPILLYDKAADRWFMSQFAGEDGNDIFIAVSATSDPLGSWYTYKWTSPDFPDYLKFSAWQDAYYMTANYAEKIFAFNRTKMLAGDASAEAVFKTFYPPNSGFFVPLPADASDGVMPGAGTPCPIFSYSDDGWGNGNIDAINIYNATVNWDTETLSINSASPLETVAFDGSYDSNWDDISQPGVTQKLDGIGGAMMFRAQWKTWAGYNTVVLNWAVQVSSSQRGIYWCELRQNQAKGDWSIYQQGIYAPGSDSYWLGSIAMNDAGGIGLAYAKASSSTYMSLGYVGRLSSDPLGTLPISEIIAQAGAGSQTSMNRVGDYSQTCLDLDGMTFWHTGEWINQYGSVETRIYSFQLPSGCTGPTTQASNFGSSEIGDNQMTISWDRGNGDAVVVVAHQGSAVDGNPSNGVNYADNAAFGSGDQIGSGNFVVYDGTGTNVTVTGLNTGTTYHYSVFEYYTADDCYLTPGLTANETTTGDNPCEYCASFGNITFDTGTTLVNFNTINNPSGKNDYSDYTAQSTDVIIGNYYELTVNANTDGEYTVASIVWIDWNQDCDFDDAGEEYDLGSAFNTNNGSTSNSPLSVLVPETALAGNTTMRVSTKYETAPTSCQEDYDGEVEDYTINVIDPTSIDELTEMGIKIYPNPTKGLLNIILPENTDNTQIIITDVTGKIVYQDNILGTEVKINLDVESGVYLIQFNFNEKTVISTIIVE